MTRCKMDHFRFIIIKKGLDPLIRDLQHDAPFVYRVNARPRPGTLPALAKTSRVITCYGNTTWECNVKL